MCKIEELKAKAKNSKSDVMGFESAAFNFAHENTSSLTARMCPQRFAGSQYFCSFVKGI